MTAVNELNTDGVKSTTSTLLETFNSNWCAADDVKPKHPNVQKKKNPIRAEISNESAADKSYQLSTKCLFNYNYADELKSLCKQQPGHSTGDSQRWLKENENDMFGNHSCRTKLAKNILILEK